MSGQRRGIKRLLLLSLLALALPAACAVEPTPIEGEPTPTAGVKFLMPTPGTPHASPSRTPTPEVIRYIVQQGDTLYDIALRYGVDMDEIIAVNNLSDPNALTVGQELLIPIQAEPTPMATPSS
ncbi:MAG: LysM peptidoglycan-binding domain-containing protein [Chloroflexia bacterium]|nr:LysM peptidoglycan-binding domain-containing protein [Chloroflexia bacterium]